MGKDSTIVADKISFQHFISSILRVSNHCYTWCIWWKFWFNNILSNENAIVREKYHNSHGHHYCDICVSYRPRISFVHYLQTNVYTRNED